VTRGPAEILRDAEATLRIAELGLEDMSAPDPDRRAAGTHNVIVWGRAVTNVLQNLRGKVDDFDGWYSPWQQEMREDELLRFFYEARTKALKKGAVPTSFTVHIKRFRVPQDLPSDPPPGAKGFFVGDQTGGSGWVTERGGVEEKVYVQLPPSQVTTWLSFVDAPNTHLGASLESQTLEHLCGLYVAYLRRLVEDAKARFG